LDNPKIKSYLSSISITEMSLKNETASNLKKSGLQSAYDLAVHYKYETLIHIKYLGTSHVAEIQEKISTLLKNTLKYFENEFEVEPSKSDIDHGLYNYSQKVNVSYKEKSQNKANLRFSGETKTRIDEHRI